MELASVKKQLNKIDHELSQAVFVILHTFERNGQLLNLALTGRLKKKAKKERLWKSKEMLECLKNASYGFVAERSRSRGGADGIFLVDRSFRPENFMMRKLFDGFLDKENSEAQDIAKQLEVSPGTLLPVRLVSHHLRLLGVLSRKENEDWLVLVDLDKE